MHNDNALQRRVNASTRDRASRDEYRLTRGFLTPQQRATAEELAGSLSLAEPENVGRVMPHARMELPALLRKQAD
jgi:hypothetical protein